MHSPLPIVFSPSQLWNGNDGNWSSFVIRVGVPEQNFRVLPSAATGELIVPHALGCQSSDGDPSDCAARRGVFDSNHKQGFVPNASTSWQEEGIFDMGLEPKLGFADSALYGRDNVGLMIQNSGGPVLENRIVGAVRQMPFFVGFFGLSPLASNFTDFSRPQRSYLTTLRDERQIPSLSYAYNAGAHYSKLLKRTLGYMPTDIGSPRVFGSLTLGGYDESRFVPNGFTFPFDQDDTQPTSLKLQQIIAERTPNGSVVILQKETYVNLDFTMPYLWLPGDTCDRIASLFKLRYDNTTKLYLVDDNAHKELMTQNPRFSFAFGDSPSLADTVSIDMPYAAFDLQASWPIYNDTKNYFPIRRAANESQYTLGRAFMQEAYIIADFERGNFSLHQAAFPKSNEQKIVSISAKNAETHQKTSSLSKDSVAGIIVGSTVFAALLIVLATLLFYGQRRSRPANQPKPEKWDRCKETKDNCELPENEVTRSQLMGTEVQELQWSREEEIDGTPRSELA